MHPFPNSSKTLSYTFPTAPFITKRQVENGGNFRVASLQNVKICVLRVVACPVHNKISSRSAHLWTPNIRAATHSKQKPVHPRTGFAFSDNKEFKHETTPPFKINCPAPLSLAQARVAWCTSMFCPSSKSVLFVYNAPAKKNYVFVVVLQRKLAYPLTFFKTDERLTTPTTSLVIRHLLPCLLPQEF